MHRGNEIINVIPVPSELKTGDKRISLETEYPFRNSFRYEIESDSDFTFRISVPSFAENLTVDGERASGEELSFTIKANEVRVINVSYDTTPHYTDRPNGLKSVECGSLVFSVPVKYERIMHEYERDGVERKFPYCDYELVPKSDWNYAYSADLLEKEEKDISKIPFSSESPAVTVKARVKKIDWGYEDGYETVCAKIPQSRDPLGDEEEIFLYPYGCAKLRMTEIPKI